MSFSILKLLFFFALTINVLFTNWKQGSTFTLEERPWYFNQWFHYISLILTYYRIQCCLNTKYLFLFHTFSPIGGTLPALTYISQKIFNWLITSAYWRFFTNYIYFWLYISLPILLAISISWKCEVSNCHFISSFFLLQNKKALKIYEPFSLNIFRFFIKDLLLS